MISSSIIRTSPNTAISIPRRSPRSPPSSRLNRRNQLSRKAASESNNTGINGFSLENWASKVITKNKRTSASDKHLLDKKEIRTTSNANRDKRFEAATLCKSKKDEIQSLEKSHSANLGKILEQSKSMERRSLANNNSSSARRIGITTASNLGKSKSRYAANQLLRDTSSRSSNRLTVSDHRQHNQDCTRVVPTSGVPPTQRAQMNKLLKATSAAKRCPPPSSRRFSMGQKRDVSSPRKESERGKSSKRDLMASSARSSSTDFRRSTKEFTCSPPAKMGRKQGDEDRNKGMQRTS